MRNVVFGMSQDQIVNELTIPHVRQVCETMKRYPETIWRFEFSPEMFSNTELEFSRRVVDTGGGSFGATPQNPVIINLPTTVENATPNCFADQIEWMHRNVAKRDCIVLSVHPHNDRGTGTAAAELAMMAGADRVEGCLFGNGERTGNVDIVNLALNMYSAGRASEPRLQRYRRYQEDRRILQTRSRFIHVIRTQETLFTRASPGSHQDAIKKAFANRDANPNGIWDMPHLPIDPMDVGRNYEAVIRVNSTVRQRRHQLPSAKRIRHRSPAPHADRVLAGGAAGDGHHRQGK